MTSHQSNQHEFGVEITCGPKCINLYPLCTDRYFNVMPTLFVCAEVLTVLLFVRGHTAGGAVGSGTALQAGRSRVRFTIFSLEFFIDIILPAALWP